MSVQGQLRVEALVWDPGKFGFVQHSTLPDYTQLGMQLRLSRMELYKIQSKIKHGACQNGELVTYIVNTVSWGGFPLIVGSLGNGYLYEK